MKRIALIGNPNCGKTTLFNTLTGSTARVGNWPGVTVDKKEGLYKKLKEALNIVDLPGVYSLSPYTPEEVVSRNFILDEKPDCVINIVDATNLERNLYLTTQLLEIDVPIVVALNMMDLVEKNGDTIDLKVLEEKLGVPVFFISAQKDKNLDKLMEKVLEESNKKRVGSSVLLSSPLSHLIHDVTTAFKGLEVDNPLFHAIKLVELDNLEASTHPQLIKIVDEFKKSFNDKTFGTDLEAVVADSRYQYVTSNYMLARVRRVKTAHVETKSEKIDRVVTHKFFGIPIFLGILFLIFHFTFSENLFYLGGLINFEGPSFEGTLFEGLIYTESGINSIGVMLQTLVENLTGAFNNQVALWLSNLSPWVAGLVVDGALSGIAAVLSFVPQILVLFLFFSILEDSGYMARAAFILDRIFRKFGLSGRSFMPMIMGFGCSVPAMINTRTLADEKERIKTIRVIPFFSCGAKLPILTAIAGGIAVVFGFRNVDLITYSMYVIGMLVAMITVIIMGHTTQKGDATPFIMELPEYHAPKPSSLALHLWDKLKHYIEKAFTVILASTIVIWVLQSFTFDWKYIEQVNIVDLANDSFESIKDDEAYKVNISNLGAEELSFEELVLNYNETDNDDYSKISNRVFELSSISYLELTGEEDYKDSADSILAGLGKLIQPIFTPLGFGSQLNQNGWVFGVSALTGLIAKENVISTMSVLAQSTTNQASINQDTFKELYLINIEEEGSSAATQMIKNAGIDSGKGWAILISFIVFNMTTIPCFAAVATAKAELPEGKMKNTIFFWLLTSFASAAVVYTVLSWWWTSFIYAIALAALFFVLKKRKV